MLAGLLLRIFLFIVCFSRFAGLQELLWSLSIGLVYDLSFVSIIFLAYFLLHRFVNEKILHYSFFICILLWMLLNAVDLFSLKYTGLRAGFYSFNLFTFHDISDKAFISPVLWPFVLLVALFIITMIYFRKKFLPVFNSQSTFQHIGLATGLFAASLLYMPYPLNYYFDQLSLTKSAKQLAINPYFS
ncbi:MAG: hypothetical protein K0S12_2402, partial [Bacteroidetes bacterium]|nr:hypothetical protein [Bacteroidota bacterium]